MRTTRLFTTAIAFGGLLAGSVGAAAIATAPAPLDDAIRGALNVSAYTLQALDLPDEIGGGFTTVVAIDGVDVTLDLRPYSIRSQDFRLLIPDPLTGLMVEQPAPPFHTLRGSVLDIPDSVLRGSRHELGLSAMIFMPDGSVWSMQPLSEVVPGSDPSLHVVYRGADSVAGDWSCGVFDDAQAGIVPPVDGGPSLGTGLKIVDIGVDADFPFYGLNGQSLQRTIDDIENVMNAVELVYERDVQITFEITTIIVRTTAQTDPYTSLDPQTLLSQFAFEWQNNRLDVQRDMAHLFTGRDLNGGVIGIANGIGNVCLSTYCLAQSFFTFQMPFRVALSAHELGHNWNGVHCDGDADCHIMCSNINGCAGIGLPNFGSRNIARILSLRNVIGCLDDLEDPRPLPFRENFPDANLRAIRWSYEKNVDVVNNVVPAPPSAPWAANLDTAVRDDVYDDDLRSNYVLMSGLSDVIVQYWTLHRGAEADDAMVVEYWSSNLRWVELNRVTSDGVDQSEWQFHAHRLRSAGAYHDEFRIRFHTEVDDRNDDFFIDEIRINNDPFFAIAIESIGADAVPIIVQPAPLNGPADGNTPLSRSFVEGTVVKFTAPALHNGESFVEWQLDGQPQTTNLTLSFTVTAAATATAVYGAPCDACDANCDGAVNAFDIEPFIGIIFEGDPQCSACAGDADGDGQLNAFDIEPFLDCLFP